MALVTSSFKVQIQSDKKWKWILIVLQSPVAQITKSQRRWVLLEACGEEKPLAGTSEVEQMPFSASLNSCKLCLTLTIVFSDIFLDRVNR